MRDLRLDARRLRLASAAGRARRRAAGDLRAPCRIRSRRLQQPQARLSRTRRSRIRQARREAPTSFGTGDGVGELAATRCQHGSGRARDGLLRRRAAPIRPRRVSAERRGRAARAPRVPGARRRVREGRPLGRSWAVSLDLHPARRERAPFACASSGAHLLLDRLAQRQQRGRRGLPDQTSSRAAAPSIAARARVTRSRASTQRSWPRGTPSRGRALEHLGTCPARCRRLPRRLPVGLPRAPVASAARGAPPHRRVVLGLRAALRQLHAAATRAASSRSPSAIASAAARCAVGLRERHAATAPSRCSVRPRAPAPRSVAPSPRVASPFEGRIAPRCSSPLVSTATSRSVPPPRPVLHRRSRRVAMPRSRSSKPARGHHGRARVAARIGRSPVRRASAATSPARRPERRLVSCQRTRRAAAAPSRRARCAGGTSRSGSCASFALRSDSCCRRPPLSRRQRVVRRRGRGRCLHGEVVGSVLRRAAPSRVVASPSRRSVARNLACAAARWFGGCQLRAPPAIDGQISARPRSRPLDRAL